MTVEERIRQLDRVAAACREYRKFQLAELRAAQKRNSK